jgi:hypothetical protein
MTLPTTAPRTTSLNQIVAIASGVKTRTEHALTRAYHQIQKPAPFTGIARTYRPVADGGESLPPESTLVQVRADDLIRDVGATLSRMLDVVATQDYANCDARADLVVEGRTLLFSVPVTYLMWLEKQVVLLRTFANKLPQLDVAQNWTYDQDAKAYRSDPVETTRGKKIPRNHVKAPATDKHPAQVDIFTEDVVVGYWRTVHFSGALPGHQIFDMQIRIENLLDAIRFAREQANSIPVTDVEAGETIVSYLFA